MRLPAVRSLVVVLVAAVGCSGDYSPPSSFATGLVGALGRVQANDDTRAGVEYGAPARVRELGERFRTLQGYGFSTISNTAKLVDEALDLDPGAFDEALVVGLPPRWGAALWGDYDLDTVNDRLGGMGIERAEEDGATRWTSGDDLEIDLAGPFSGVVQTNQFNSIRTGDGSFAYAPAAAGVDWVTRGGAESLADDPQVGGLARCLGDVVAAQIVGEHAAGARADGTEVICVDGDKATVESALDGDVVSTGAPWDELLSGLTVDQDDAFVRVTAPGRDGEPVGRALRAMMTGDLRDLT